MIALSFSGGKDSMLALYELQKRSRPVHCLFTTVWSENERTVAHEESLRSIREQANRLQIPIHFIYTSFETYAEDFVAVLKQLKKIYSLTTIAFGDWYLQGHRDWGETQAKKIGLQPCYPLWSTESEMVNKLRYFIGLGFKAKVIKIDREKLPQAWLGRIIDESFVEDIVQYDVCPMGENGEYHTRVIDGPVFKQKIK